MTRRGPVLVSASNMELRERTKGSLVPETLKEMETDVDFQRTKQALLERGQAALTAEERKKRRRALDNLGVPSFDHFLKEQGLSPLTRKPVTTLQLNIGLYCNQACAHCHVESSPLRTEQMDERVARKVVEVLDRSPEIHTVDITGGAPELQPQFRYLVTEARRQGKEVIDRCNLTVLYEPGQEDLVDFLADNQVRIVASMPCYGPKNVDDQRGRGVFEKSIQALLDLNARGYGKEGSGLLLDLVYNPIGGFLPPLQSSLEAAYKDELSKTYGITFNSLFTITNMPIKRFADHLSRKGELQAYMELLVNNFNPAAADSVMCRDLISVGWDGTVYDCDFNQQLALGMPPGLPKSIFDIDSTASLLGARIATDNHCFGCTAGHGSSCTGAVA
ncbi:hypothetical protein KFL_000070430 [Klebsormidium nitens]|uniref:Fe-S oxidoreductase n=1 Tax=Klebsormidium nitens TaxID=105231 RepID=A0A1Y1HHY5_KLENI|nr:hypothetical protein KFL_000070430 [Klebsormidium nitens]|eukprot:GAQ78074.1 hypothetical protein KFL_000070430 [Klebsormidium nitens]